MAVKLEQLENIKDTMLEVIMLGVTMVKETHIMLVTSSLVLTKVRDILMEDMKEMEVPLKEVLVREDLIKLSVIMHSEELDSLIKEMIPVTVGVYSVLTEEIMDTVMVMDIIMDMDTVITTEKREEDEEEEDLKARLFAVRALNLNTVRVAKAASM